MNSTTNCLLSSENVLFDFTNSSASVDDWIEISDTERDVGKSKGVLVEQKTQQFQRAIFFSLLNPQPNGAAFVGVSYRKKSFDLSLFTGLKLSVRAQGENFVYKVILRHHNEQSSLQPSYEIFFELPKNEMIEKYLSFTDFKPYSRGKALDPDTTPPLDLTDISSIGLQIFGGVYSPIKQHGTSSLEIDSISAVKCE
ncbi:unnamed protein product [Adineta steineri]|uniref:NADH:ubiquinone oxidoreductase intermediate-associated protein 30 domain-containing protein n=1 Tax=Adineta steineri TaxID=433720 RepID=A0A814SN14_9BILA|nr:unnamed protein product [Adineta steineri]CAF1150438.1 unnamed protein product [Adineta steineri]CAF3775384.1 unnamed protein product [Adineta steineri]